MTPQKNVVVGPLRWKSGGYWTMPAQRENPSLQDGNRTLKMPEPPFCCTFFRRLFTGDLLPLRNGALQK